MTSHPLYIESKRRKSEHQNETIKQEVQIKRKFIYQFVFYLFPDTIKIK